MGWKLLADVIRAQIPYPLKGVSHVHVVCCKIPACRTCTLLGPKYHSGSYSLLLLFNERSLRSYHERECKAWRSQSRFTIYIDREIPTAIQGILRRFAPSRACTQLPVGCITMSAIDTSLRSAHNYQTWEVKVEETDLETLNPMAITHPFLVAVAWFLLNKISPREFLDDDPDRTSSLSAFWLRSGNGFNSNKEAPLLPTFRSGFPLFHLQA